MTTTTNRCKIATAHCENCGSTAPENIDNLFDTQGYTRCCNELVAITAAACRCFHN
jgi:hypothetical protein